MSDDLWGKILLAIIPAIFTGVAVFLGQRAWTDRAVENRLIQALFMSAARTCKLMKKLEEDLANAVEAIEGELKCDVASFNLQNLPGRINLVKPDLAMMDALQKVRMQVGAKVEVYLFQWSRIVATEAAYADSFKELVKAADAGKPGPAFNEYCSRVRGERSTLEKMAGRLHAAAHALCVECENVLSDQISSPLDKGNWIPMASDELWKNRGDMHRWQVKRSQPQPAATK